MCEVPVSQNSVLSAEGEQDKDCCYGLRMYPGHRTCSRDIPFLEHPSGATLYTVVLKSNLLTHSEIDKISYQRLSLEILQLLVGVIPYSGLFSWVEIFVKSWERFPELNFVVLNFVARWDRSRMT